MLVFHRIADVFPFGPFVGDGEVPPFDDGSSGAIFLSLPFPYFGTSESIIYVSSACGD